MRVTNLDINNGSIWMFKCTSKVSFLLNLHFKEFFKHKPFTFKGFHKTNLWIAKVFQRSNNLRLAKKNKKKRLKTEILITLFPLLQWNTKIHVKSWFPDTYKIMHNCTLWHTYNMVQKFVNLAMVMCISVTFENWFFSFEIQRFALIDIWTSKEKQRKWKTL